MGSHRYKFAAFIYSVSHDLNAPVRHINSFSQITLKESGDELDEKSKTYFDFIVRAGENLETMLGGFLVLSRLIRQQEPFTKTSVENVISKVWEHSLFEEVAANQA